MMEGTEKVVVGGRSALLDWMTPVTSKVDKRRRRGANNWEHWVSEDILQTLAVVGPYCWQCSREKWLWRREKPQEWPRSNPDAKNETHWTARKSRKKKTKNQKNQKNQKCVRTRPRQNLFLTRADAMPRRPRKAPLHSLTPPLASNTGCQLFLSGSPPKKPQKNTPHGQEFLHTITSKYNE